MAIFIIDQFSLNTDLPLDIRYVPSAGRFDPDISVYKYPGMQVFDTNTESIWYADNSLNWVEVGSGSDASLNALWNLVLDLSTYITENVDVSINNLYQITNQLDASIQRIDVSLNSYGTLLEIHEASIGDLTARVVLLESSVAYLTDWQLSQDASIENLVGDISQLEASIARLDASIVRIDTSLGQLDAQIQINVQDILQIEASIADINTYQGIQDASIAANELDILQIEASIADINTYQGIQDSSIAANTLDIQVIDGSITFLTNYNGIQDASIAQNTQDILAIETSLGDYVRKDGDTMTGALVITGGGLEVGSIGTPLDVSIYSNLYVHENTFIGGNLTIDGSLYVVNVETIDVSAGFIHLNTGLTGTPPSTMQSGIVIGRGDLEPYVFIFDETNQTFRIGIAAETSTGYLYSSKIGRAHV